MIDADRVKQRIPEALRERTMLDNVDNITNSNVLPITARYQMILDAKQRMWDGVPFDEDGLKRAPVCDDEMPGYLSGILGRTITAADELAQQAPSALYVLRGSLESTVYARDLVMDDATRAAYRATIEALDRAQAALGVPLSKRSKFFEVKVKRGAPAPPPDTEPEMQRMSNDELRGALTDARIRCQAIETEIGRRATASARALAAAFVELKK